MNKPKDLPSNLIASDDIGYNVSSNEEFSAVLEARINRRNLLRGGLAAAVGAALTACGGSDYIAPTRAPTTAPTAAPTPAPLSLGFTAVPKSVADVLTVPAGYTATVLYALGDPLTASTPAFKNDGTDTDFDNRAGDHHDGIGYFGLNATSTARDANSSDRALLAMNHEALTDQFLHANGVTANPRPAAEADKEIPAHGISIVEIRKNAQGRFEYQKDSSYNRRITPNTPIELSGPVRGHALLKTKYSAAGTATRGTINNCGAGVTPWGTFFSGEENWNGYFTRSATDDAARGGATAKSVVSLARYGKSQGSASRHGWETAGADDKYVRWNISQTGASSDGSDDYRNEMNTYGYMLEVDPYTTSAAPRKRTALGRFAHEMGIFGRDIEGKPLAVYLGDDSRGEYIYKFVSSANWSAADATGTNRIATGDKYLDSGKLYVAKFNADGSGQWIELTMANTLIANYANYKFADQADLLVNARLAADAVGATKMDRPEWSAVNPANGEVYLTLTNNSNRKVEPSGSSQQGVDAPNPRSYTDAPATNSAGNVNGHIIRLRESGSENAAVAFNWDIYLFGAESGMDGAKINLSSLTADNDMSSPDGVFFSKSSGFLFIQTDDGAYTDVTNCMMLVARPGQVGDGASKTISHTKADASALSVTTYVGKAPTSETLKRFLVGPKDCEITGITETPDGKTIFVNIQHPGETISKANIADPAKYLSHWPGNAGYGPGGANARPRSSTVAITKNDGGIVGT